MTVERVAAHLRRRLAGQGVYPQQRLKPERTLAAELGCSRATLRGALDVLERDGLVWRHVGRGTFAGVRPRQENIKPAVLAAVTTPLELLDARLVLEPAIAAEAARRAGADDVARLRVLAARTGAAASWQAYEALDGAFHQAVAAATGSRLLMATLGTLAAVRGRARWQRRHVAAFHAAHQRAYSVRQGRMHAEVVAAIAAHDGGAARAAMRAHLLAIRKLFVAATQSADDDGG